ncbi:DNA-binding response regulator [Nonomuraea ferruginea]
MTAIRVMLAEDMHMIRAALTALLRLESDIDVVAEVTRGDEIVPAALEHRPDVAIVDIDLPVVDGITAAAELRARLPECRILVLTALGQPGQVRRALAAGIGAFLVKDAPGHRLADAIRRTAAGLRVLDPELVSAAMEYGESPLTPRESTVLREAARGASAEEIASRLHLSPGTVRNYLTGAITKTGARNKIDAIRIAEDASWL